MEIYMLANGNQIKKKEMVNISGKMVIDMKDGSHKTFQMVRDHYFTQMDKYTQANGNKTKNMEKEH